MSDDQERETPAPDGGPNNPRPGAEVTRLAAHLRRLTDRVEQVAARQADLGVTVSEQLAPAYLELRDQIANLEGQLHEVLDVLEQDRRTAPVHWPALTVEQARREWALLAQWIEDVLVPWYSLTRGQLPDCWALHRSAVVELSWWRVIYAQSFASRSPGTLAGEWHDRWRRVALANIRSAIPERSCGPGRHQTSDDEPRARSSVEPAGGSWRQDPAERRHWRDFYEQAVADDLRWRGVRSQPDDSPVLPVDSPDPRELP